MTKILLLSHTFDPVGEGPEEALYAKNELTERTRNAHLGGSARWR